MQASEIVLGDVLIIKGRRCLVTKVAPVMGRTEPDVSVTYVDRYITQTVTWSPETLVRHVAEFAELPLFRAITNRDWISIARYGHVEVGFYGVHDHQNIYGIGETPHRARVDAAFELCGGEEWPSPFDWSTNLVTLSPMTAALCEAVCETQYSFVTREDGLLDLSSAMSDRVCEQSLATSIHRDSTGRRGRYLSVSVR